MPTPKLTSLDLTVLFGFTGRRSSAARLDLPAALDHLKSGLAELARQDGDAPLLALLFAQSRRRGGNGGAPAELGLPQPPAEVAAPIAARPAATQYARA